MAPGPPERSGRSPAGAVARRAKHAMRHVVDRLAMPYVEEVTRRVAGGHGGGSAVPRVFVELPLTLHEARTLALEDMPAGARTLVSAGASGRWYFDWIEEHYGRVERHVGVEAFSPRPADLPANVEWVSADIASPSGVAALETGSADLVYSGQNLEHLWPEQVVSFLRESHRVLGEGGWLVVDSPNRDLTSAYRWSMAEHTVELTPAEARTMLALAGFRVVTLKGLWLGRERGRLLPLDPSVDEGGPSSVLRRMVLATARPEDSFLWWAEARRAGAPDPDGLEAHVRQVFDRNWLERLNRLLPGPGTTTDATGVVSLARGLSGEVLSGPSMALPPGTFTFELPIGWARAEPGTAGKPGPEPVAVLEVVAGGEVLGSCEVTGRAGEGREVARVTVSLSSTRFAVGVWVRSTGVAGISASTDLRLSPRPW